MHRHFLMAVSVLGGVALSVSGCAPRPVTSTPGGPPRSTSAAPAHGQRLYAEQCAACHGLQGRGDGAAAYLLYPKPRDFTQNEFRLVSTSTMQATDEDLFQTITRGMPGSAMPPWESLTVAQRRALVSHVRHLTGAAEPVDPASSIRVPSETPNTPEGLERGRQLFAQACASCHGPLGQGDGPQAMVDNAGVPILPRNLTAGIFKGSSGSRDLYLRIIAGLPGSPMPSYAGAYTDDQIWDLVHYVQSLVPAGVEERVRLRHHSLQARQVSGVLSLDPAAPAWSAVPATYVALTPLWWRDQRIEGVEVKALHNGKELALQLSWADPTMDHSLLTPQAFSDGVAVQFSTDQHPPFFGMGGAAGTVQMWHWKAAWQDDVQEWRDIEAQYPSIAVDWHESQRDYQHGAPFEASQSKTAGHDPQYLSGWGAGNPLSNPHRASGAEEVMAKGAGTLTSRAPTLQRVQAQGLWRDGRWVVVLHRALAPNESNDLALRPGRPVSVAFAVWDGSAHDRNGQKNVSIWNTLTLER